ncbi:hypothetical protein V6N11_001780 [Hibiscus sabdariffa]|uniref:Uncharacterized protein n=1 Tax=Hibiscus sabdariffa TaxID=183260 RepID=A0ABR2QTG4_9ROSI
MERGIVVKSVVKILRIHVKLKVKVEEKDLGLDPYNPYGDRWLEFQGVISLELVEEHTNDAIATIDELRDDPHLS